MTAFLWTYTDLANLKIAYAFGMFTPEEFRERYETMRTANASPVSVCNSSAGGDDCRGADHLDDVGVSDD